MAMDNHGYESSKDKSKFVVTVRAKMASLPNISLLVSQEIWGITNSSDSEPMTIIKHGKEGCDDQTSLQGASEHGVAIHVPRPLPLPEQQQKHKQQKKNQKVVMVEEQEEGVLVRRPSQKEKS